MNVFIVAVLHLTCDFSSWGSIFLVISQLRISIRMFPGMALKFHMWLFLPMANAHFCFTWARGRIVFIPDFIDGSQLYTKISSRFTHN